MDCIMLSKCPFYNDKMPMDKGIGLIYKKKYCNGNNEQCARYKVYVEVGGRFLNNNLYPNMHDIAIEIIKGAKSSET